MMYDEKLNTLTFDATETKIPGYTYEVDLDRIQLESDLLKWVVQLMPKMWVTKSLLDEFITRVAEIKGRNFSIYGLR